MHILFILPQIEKGGGQVIQAIGLAQYFKSRKHNITIISDRSKLISRDSLEYIKSLDIQFIRNKSYNYIFFLRYLSLFLKTFNLIHSRQFDIIQIFEPHLSGLIGIFFKRIYKIPIIIRMGAKYIEYYKFKFRKSKFKFKNIFVLGIFGVFLKLIERITIRNSNYIIANCEFIKNNILNKNYLRNLDKIQVIPSGIKIDRNENIKDIQRNIDINFKYILYIGRIEKYKGIDILLDAFEHILNNNDSIKLILIGSTEINKLYYKDLKNKIKLKGLTKKIIFKGTISHSIIFKYLKRSEMLIVPSLKGKYKIEEGLPNVILEAFKMNCPVIASNVGGIHEIIKNNKTGLIYNPSDAKDLYKKIVFLLKNDNLKKKIIKKAKEYLIKERDLKKSSEKYLKLYEKLIKNR